MQGWRVSLGLRKSAVERKANSSELVLGTSSRREKGIKYQIKISAFRHQKSLKKEIY